MPKRTRTPSHRNTPDPLAREIGKRIRGLRKSSNVSYDAFVEESGLGRGYVSELERGLTVPGVGVLERVARVLDVTLADLVLGDTAREKLFEATRGADERVIGALMDHLEKLAAGSK